MSQKNPVKKLVQLKVLNAQDTEGREAADELDLEAMRPRTRADCLPGGINSQRPCPWYSCRAHNGLDINEDTGSMSVRSLDVLVHSCALDVAEIGGAPGSGRGSGISLEELGDIMGLTKERSRQIEYQAMRHLDPILTGKGLAPDKRDDIPCCKACGGIDHTTSKCKINDGRFRPAVVSDAVTADPMAVATEPKGEE